MAQFIFDETKYRMLLKGKYTAQKCAGELSLLAAHGRVLVGDADRVLVEEEVVLQPVGLVQSSGVTRLCFSLFRVDFLSFSFPTNNPPSDCGLKVQIHLERFFLIFSNIIGMSDLFKKSNRISA